MKTYQKTLSKNIRAMTRAEARAWLERYAAEQKAKGLTCDMETVRELTGGYASQSINFIVVRAVHERQHTNGK